LLKAKITASSHKNIKRFMICDNDYTQGETRGFASAAFVTGNLDAVHQQADFLELVQSLTVPLMVVIGESSPPKSREEMNALVALPGVRSVVIPGSLGLHEEYPAVVLEAVENFLFSPEN
jgi:pimeloyl-ACP methyl ester carboxylesterase